MVDLSGELSPLAQFLRNPKKDTKIGIIKLNQKIRNKNGILKLNKKNRNKNGILRIN